MENLRFLKIYTVEQLAGLQEAAIARIGMGGRDHVTRARKCRLMGSAALDLAYVACGRLDAYIEQSVSLWDVAAGQILVESAGGAFSMTPREDQPEKISVVASSGKIDLEL